MIVGIVSIRDHALDMTIYRCSTTRQKFLRMLAQLSAQLDIRSLVGIGNLLGLTCDYLTLCVEGFEYNRGK